MCLPNEIMELSIVFGVFHSFFYLDPSCSLSFLPVFLPHNANVAKKRRLHLRSSVISSIYHSIRIFSIGMLKETINGEGIKRAKSENSTQVHAHKKKVK